MIPNEIFEEEVIEAECVISTLPVWNVLRVVPRADLPDWYAAQIKHLARVEFRATWLGVYVATEEPVLRGLRARAGHLARDAPASRTPGFFFNQTAMDPSTSPPGTHLYVAGLDIPGEKGRDVKWMLRTMEAFERGPRGDVPGPASAPSGAGATWSTSPGSA